MQLPALPPKRGGPDEVPAPGINFVSASQLKTWWECQRKWGWEKIAGLRGPSGRGAALGSMMHDQAETYLRDDKLLDFTIKDPYGVYPAEVLATGLQYIPQPKSPGMDVERYFKFPLPDDSTIWIRGFKDYRFGADHRAIADGADGVYLLEDGLPHVGDHKSCGNWQYALTADDLLGDPQAIIYAYDELLRAPHVDAVTLQWTYYGTKKKYVSRPVRRTITRSQVMEVFPEIIRGAVDLVTMFRSKPASPLLLPYNADACGKYGGCPFQGNCNLSPKERRSSLFMTTTNTADLLAKTAARKAELTGTPAPKPGETPLQAKIRLARERAASPTPESEAARTLPVTPLAQSTASMYAPGSEPPAADPTKIPAAFATPPPKLPVSDQPINPPGDFQPPPTSDAAREAAEAAALAEIVPPAAKKPGRPVGSTNKPTAPVIPADALALLTDVLGLAKRALEKYLGAS